MTKLILSSLFNIQRDVIGYYSDMVSNSTELYKSFHYGICKKIVEF